MMPHTALRSFIMVSFTFTDGVFPRDRPRFCTARLVGHGSLLAGILRRNSGLAYSDARVKV